MIFPLKLLISMSDCSGYNRIVSQKFFFPFEGDRKLTIVINAMTQPDAAETHMNSIKLSDLTCHLRERLNYEMVDKFIWFFIDFELPNKRPQNHRGETAPFTCFRNHFSLYAPTRFLIHRINWKIHQNANSELCEKEVPWQSNFFQRISIAVSIEARWSF